jgi:hypothetical protein
MNTIPSCRPVFFAGTALLLAAGAAFSQAPAGDPSASSAGSGAPYETSPRSRQQASASGNENAYSLLPYTRRGYVGVNLGRTEFDTACGSGGYGCDNPNVSGYFYTGGLFNDWVGLELGYMNSGRADRSGGRTRAEGLNVSLLLRAPLGQFNAFIKGGTTYAQTRVSSGPLSDVPSGKRRAWAPSYGAGLGFDFTPNHGLVLEWNRTEMRFVGIDGRQNVDTTSLGYVYRF